jgi:hypothetical protein
MLDILLSHCGSIFPICCVCSSACLKLSTLEQYWVRKLIFVYLMRVFVFLYRHFTSKVLYAHPEVLFDSKRGVPAPWWPHSSEVGLKGAHHRRVHLVVTATPLAPVVNCRCATPMQRGAFEWTDKGPSEHPSPSRETFTISLEVVSHPLSRVP